MGNRFTIAGTIALILAVSCQDSTSPSDELSAARHRWEAWGPSSYDLVVRKTCECLPAGVRVVVAVRDGVISRYDLDSGQPITQQFLAYPDASGFFDFIVSEMAKAQTVEVRYDAITGIPKQIDVDRQSWPVDGGYSLAIELRRPAIQP